jgi:hypothetical protein
MRLESLEVMGVTVKSIFLILSTAVLLSITACSSSSSQPSTAQAPTDKGLKPNLPPEPPPLPKPPKKSPSGE